VILRYTWPRVGGAERTGYRIPCWGLPPMATNPVPEAQVPVNHFGRLFGVLFNPKETFEAIARRPSWVAPVILLTVLNVAVIVVFTQRVGWERFMRQQLEHSPRAEQMTPQEREHAIGRGTQFAQGVAFVASVVAYPVVVAVIAGVLMLAFNLIAGAEVRYSMAAGVASHAMMPFTIISALAIVVLCLKDPDTINLGNLVGSNVGALLASDTPPWLMKLGASLDLFSFWAIALLAVGFSAANSKKIPVGRALGVVIVLWAAYVFVKVGWAAALS